LAHANLQLQSPRSRERVFKKNTQWYFHTREEIERGPFIDKQQAYWALAKYIRQQCSYR
jgi:N-acyl-L-homoserine lactone synthetase